jgi:predicted flap endonuclease-1-like 5' DNA nuclease
MAHAEPAPTVPAMAPLRSGMAPLRSNPRLRRASAPAKQPKRNRRRARGDPRAPAPAPAAADPGEGTRPAALEAAREGGADDLKRIKGIGPKLEKLCNRLGFYHFDQIAAWTADEVAWVDQNLEGFKGRVTRDNWVEQARLLASGGETEFSKKVDKGDVY